jgi:hypothetical protein
MAGAAGGVLTDEALLATAIATGCIGCHPGS